MCEEVGETSDVNTNTNLSDFYTNYKVSGFDKMQMISEDKSEHRSKRLRSEKGLTIVKKRVVRPIDSSSDEEAVKVDWGWDSDGFQPKKGNMKLKLVKVPPKPSVEELQHKLAASQEEVKELKDDRKVKEDEMHDKIAELQAEKKNLVKKESDLENKEVEVKASENWVAQKQVQLRAKERELVTREAVVRKREAELVAKSEEMEDLTVRGQRLEEEVRGRVECPVCLAIPTEGPIYSCPHGHLVCSAHLAATCPTCRAAMAATRSLLAEAIVRVLLHECPHQGCTTMCRVEELAAHTASCTWRPVTCPSSTCRAKMPVGGLVQHLIDQNQGSVKEVAGGKVFMYFSSLVTASNQVSMIRWDSRVFLLTTTVALDQVAFTILLLGTRVEASGYTATTGVRDPDRVGESLPRRAFINFGQPCSIEVEDEEEREASRLVIKLSALKQLYGTVRTEHFRVDLTFAKI